MICSPVFRCAGAVLMLLGPVTPVAAAIGPPPLDPHVAVPNPTPVPVGEMTQRSPCVTSGVVVGTDPGATSASSLALDLPGAWRHSRGEGQLVAVIGSGVQPGPRLPNVEAGGDFVGSTDGLTDCDGSGTLVAGLIAGQPGPDGFSGVAPGARILSIRQNSPRYSPRATGGEDPAVARASVEMQALARAVVRAADLGARVITIPSAICFPASKNADQREVGAALRYAAVDKDAVIVAAAGDTSSGQCRANPLGDPARPADPRNWDAVDTLSVPAWWQPYVLAVGSLAPDGRPSEFTAAGPWIGIAAPGEAITSVSNDTVSNATAGGLANGLPVDEDMAPVRGTGYAAAYVSGVAALLRSRFPALTADQVKDRLTGTAHGAARSPSNLVGAGTLDPVAALTWNVPASRANADADGDAARTRQLAAPPPPAVADPTPRIVAFGGVAVLAAVVLGVAAVRMKRKETSR